MKYTDFFSELNELKDPEFVQYIENVKKEVQTNQNRLVVLARKIMPEADITAARVGGSFANGRATPESDVDLEIFYRGNVEPEDVADRLYGKLSGNFSGVYDIVPNGSLKRPRSY